MNAGFNPVLAGIAGNFVQGMYAHIQQVIVLVADPDGFLPLSVDLDFLHSCVNSHPVIHVHDIVAGFKVK